MSETKITPQQAAAQKSAETKAAAQANPNQSTKSVVDTIPTSAVSAPHPVKMTDEQIAAKQAEMEKAKAEVQAKAASEDEANKSGEPETISDKELAALIGDEAMSKDSNADEGGDEDATYRKKMSAQKLSLITKAFPASTPDSHVLFGYAAINITVGDLRRVFGD